MVLAPFAGGRQTNDYDKIRVYACPSYPNKQQLVCYVVNAWEFTDPNDFTGRPKDGPSRLSVLQRPAITIYSSDVDTQVPIVTTNTPNPGWNDVWSATHLPYSTGSRRTPNPARRVSLARHDHGDNLLLFDAHTAWKKAIQIVPDDWRNP